MKGYTAINYCVFVKTIFGKYYYTKTSIINNVDKWEPAHEITKSDFAYDTFMGLFPTLVDFKRDDIEIVRCWESFHPFIDKIPANPFDKSEHEFLDRCFNSWLDDKLKIKIEDEKET